MVGRSDPSGRPPAAGTTRRNRAPAPVAARPIPTPSARGAGRRTRSGGATRPPVQEGRPAVGQRSEAGAAVRARRSRCAFLTRRAILPRPMPGSSEGRSGRRDSLMVSAGGAPTAPPLGGLGWGAVSGAQLGHRDRRARVLDRRRSRLEKVGRDANFITIFIT